MCACVNVSPMLDGSGFRLGALQSWRPMMTCLLVGQRYGPSATAPWRWWCRQGLRTPGTAVHASNTTGELWRMGRPATSVMMESYHRPNGPSSDHSSPSCRGKSSMSISSTTSCGQHHTPVRPRPNHDQRARARGTVLPENGRTRRWASPA